MRTHLPLLVALSLVSCQTSGSKAEIDTSRPNRSFQFVYDAAVAELPEGAQSVRLWIPLPEDTADQIIDGLQVKGLSGNVAFEIPEKNLVHGRATGSKNGVSWTVADIEGGQGRSLCVETQGRPIELEMRFDVTRYETTGGGEVARQELMDYLHEDSMIPLDGKVATMASSMAVPEEPKRAARMLYDHTLERMRYDKPEGEAWGRGDAEWACDSRFGNCTDFHSYFIGLSRSKGIPARFEMGFPVAGGDERVAEVGGYHCWAYFWTEDGGWVPVDISEADKHPEKANYFFGTLDHDRVTMTGGRDLTLDPMPAQGTLNFLVYPYAEVDGEAWAKVEKSFQRINAD